MTYAKPVQNYVRGPQPALIESQPAYIQEELRKVEQSFLSVQDALRDLEEGNVLPVDLNNIEALESLPTTGDFVGQVKYLISDNTFYRWGGTAWVDDVISVFDPALDLTGQVDLNSFVPGLEAVGIVNSLPSTSGYTGAKVIYNTADGKLYRLNAGAWTTAVLAADISGTLGPSNFSNSLRPVDIVGTLPTTGNFIGRVAVLTTDGKLYRYTATGWSAAVNTTDLTGQLADAQIASIAASKVTGQLGNAQLAELSTAKLVGTIVNTQLADSSVSTEKIIANAVVADKIAANAVTAGKIAANAVVADNIAANAITSPKIEAGAITTAKIAAGAVTAGNIAAGNITADKLATNSVTSDAIVANAITTGKIAAGAITTDLLAANSITAGKIAAANVITSSAQISDSIITNAKIGNLQVDTIKIANNAVTSGVLTSNNNLYLQAATYEQGFISAYYVGSGAQRIISVSGEIRTAYDTCIMRLYINGVNVRQWYELGVGGGYSKNFYYSYADISSTGGETIEWRFFTQYHQPSTTFLTAPAMTIIEYKK